MPRGVAIPEVREQLFAAADRVLARDGPAGLTTRAITAEAGVANGVMHRHFRDLDAFLAAFAGIRFAAIAGTAASLPSRAGKSSVAANLTDAVVALFGLVFLPAATFPVVDAEISGVIGLAMAIFGGALAAID